MHLLSTCGTSSHPELQVPHQHYVNLHVHCESGSGLRAWAATLAPILGVKMWDSEEKLGIAEN